MNRRVLQLFVCAAALASPLGAQQISSTPAVSPTPAGEPVVMGGRTLFSVRQGHGSFTARERARAIEERIRELAREAGPAGVRLRIAEGEGGTEVVSGERVLVTITDRDAAGLGLTRQEAAKNAAAIVEQAVNEAHQEYRTKSLILDALYALLATAALVLIFRLLGRGARVVLARIDALRARAAETAAEAGLGRFGADRLARTLAALVRALHAGILIIAVLAFLAFLFFVFPGTRPAVRALIEALLSPLSGAWRGFIAYLPSLASLVVIVILTRVAIKIVRTVFDEIEGGTIVLARFEPEWAPSTYRIVRLLILAFALVVAFPYLPGSDSAAFKGVSIFLGVLFSLSSTTAVGNAVAGTILTYTRAFRPGDRVQIGDTVGFVVEKALFVTHIKTTKNEEVAVPNAVVLASRVVNFSRAADREGLILHTSVTIGYDAPWRRVHELLIAAARATPGILAEPEPFVLQTALNDFFVTYEINAHTNQPLVTHTTYSKLHQNIQDKFNEGGVEIMSPHYASVRDGNTVTIPAEKRPASYRPGALRVHEVSGDEKA